MQRSKMVLAAVVAMGACSNEAGAAKSRVADQLRDPASAQFREVKVVRQADGSSAVCGEVNGKNAYGGYVGFRGFVVRGSEVHIRNDDINYGDVAEIEAATAAIRASTKYCLLAGRPASDVEASSAEMQARLDGAGS